MKLHQTQTEFNCGIDLHARNMYICVMDRQGKVLVHRNIRQNDFGFLPSPKRTGPAVSSGAPRVDTL